MLGEPEWIPRDVIGATYGAVPLDVFPECFAIIQKGSEILRLTIYILDAHLHDGFGSLRSNLKSDGASIK
jgi:hypothetical protein